MQMEHSVFVSWASISLLTGLRSNLASASSVAGGAALELELFSMRLEMILSKASCEYTASPTAALAGSMRAIILCKLAIKSPGPGPGPMAGPLPPMFGSESWSCWAPRGGPIFSKMLLKCCWKP